MSSGNSSIEVSMKPFQDMYQSKDWLKAMQWLDANQAQLGNGLYHFNKGILALKLDQLPLARFHFESAESSGFRDPWVYKNIETIRSELGLQLVEQKSFYQQVKSKVLGTISADYIISAGLLIFLAIVLYWVKKKIQKSFYQLIFLLGITFVIGIFVFSVSDTSLEIVAKNEAIILEEVSIYEGPSAIFEELGKLPPGLKVTWSQNENGWAQITTPVNFRGWIQFSEKYIKQL